MANVLCLAAVLVGFIIGCAIKLSGRDGGRSIDLSVNSTTQPASPRSIRRTRGRNRRNVDPVVTQQGILAQCVIMAAYAGEDDGDGLVYLVVNFVPTLEANTDYTVSSGIGVSPNISGYTGTWANMFTDAIIAQSVRILGETELAVFLGVTGYELPAGSSVIVLRFPEMIVDVDFQAVMIQAEGPIVLSDGDTPLAPEPRSWLPQSVSRILGTFFF